MPARACAVGMPDNCYDYILDPVLSTSFRHLILFASGPSFCQLRLGIAGTPVIGKPSKTVWAYLNMASESDIVCPGTPV